MQLELLDHIIKSNENFKENFKQVQIVIDDIKGNLID